MPPIKTMKEKKFIVRAALFILILGLGYSVVNNYMSTKAAPQLQKDLLAQYGKKAMMDPFTDQVICKESLLKVVKRDVAKGVKNKLIKFEMCGGTYHGVPSEVEVLKKANEFAMADKKCIELTSSFRSNAYQKELSDKKVDGVVGCVCCSFHVSGRAFDVKNWFQVQKYLWKAGFNGGSHGLYADPWHFSRGGEFPVATGLSKIKNWLWIGKNAAKTRISRWRQ